MKKETAQVPREWLEKLKCLIDDTADTYACIHPHLGGIEELLEHSQEIKKYLNPLK